MMGWFGGGCRFRLRGRRGGGGGAWGAVEEGLLLERGAAVVWNWSWRWLRGMR